MSAEVEAVESYVNFEAIKSTCIGFCSKIIAELEIDIPSYRSKYGIPENEDLTNSATVIRIENSDL